MPKKYLYILNESQKKKVFPIQHSTIGLYNRVSKCFPLGTNWTQTMHRTTQNKQHKN